MGKVLWVEDEEQLDEGHPGCMSGLFHAFDCHYWYSNVKKILPHRKHEALIKHNKRNRRYKRISDDQDAFEVLKLLDAKTSHILVDPSNSKTLTTQKGSLKTRIKTFFEDNDKEQGHDQDFISSPKLQRTCSIHHLETNEWVHPIIFFPENVTENTVSSKMHGDLTNPDVKDPRDILDILKVDKELFVNTLQDCSLSSDREPKLTKCGSFPSAYKLASRNLMPLKLEDKLNEIYTISKAEKTKNSHDDHYGKNVIRLRRVSSLNESAYRGTRFLDLSVGKEATLRTSRSLKLTNESENLINNPNQVFRDSYFHRSSSQNERTSVSLSLFKDKYAELNATQDCESLNEVMDKSDALFKHEHSPKANSLAFCEDANGLKDEEDNIQICGEFTQESPVFAPEYCPLDEKVQISEGFQENVEKEIKTVKNKKHIIESSTKDDDFTYVKKILERSGFIKNGFQQTWHSCNQPLDPFVFQEIESHYYHDPKRFEEEVNELSHRLLIFDLVDEVLLTMYDRSLTYYPKRLTSLCHIRPAPTGSLVLDEVWNHISRLLNFKHDINESLNDIVSRDLGSDDGWMNLQLDSECVGLDLEDLILDEVLEQVVFELI